MTTEDFSPPAFLASAAVSVCDTWADPDKRRIEVLACWRASFGSEPGLLCKAAEAVAALPKPIPDKVKDIERMQQIRKVIGATSPEDELLAMLDARELLQELAREFG
ncbi:hypothetical protein KK092_09655 [Curtobacterium flaccumfaciens pv. flaccumfaciens]|uniref:hypothetical protein n=1 Tax=Curtobacterium flaccumfaciens TaxID=2035 RepID=UPI001BDE48F4|nr:hypothetical protein [Curtobacterium flaccumfaciens]MBT1669646.1 hypothetical protein [Curtobacterium flaccumfaciens pv. flaccumfaciens]